MKRPRMTFGALAASIALVAIGLVTLSPTVAGASGGLITRPDQPVPGQYIVTLRPSGDSIPGAAALLARLHGGSVVQTFQSALSGFTVRMSDAQAQALASDPRVAAVEQDGYVHALDTQTPTPSWGLDRIDQRDLPGNSSYSYGYGPATVHAYIIDTGIRTSNTDFGGRASVGVDEIGDGQNGQDCAGHGTHVAGTVGGSTYGVAKNVLLVAVRVLNCSGSGTYTQVIAGIDWVTAHAIKPAVANMSLGGTKSTALNNAVANSISSGVTYAVAAGNSNANACSYSPSSTTAAITVGATTSADARASFSNIGTCVDIFAPGDTIVSDWYTSDTATATLSGTSMATPHVTGTAALYLEANQSATPAQVASALTANATTGHVTSPGTGSPNLLLYEGFLVPTAPPPPPQPTAPGTPVLTATPGNGTVSLSWTAPGPGSKPITGYNIYRSTTPGGEGPVPIATVGNVTSYPDLNLANGQPYYYQVSAMNAEPLTGPLSNEATATPVAAQPPGAPTLTATQPFFFFSGVQLSWTTPPAGSSPITGYKLYRSTVSGQEVLYATIGVTTSGRDTGTTRGTRYYYKLTAVSAAGESDITLANEASAIAR